MEKVEMTQVIKDQLEEFKQGLTFLGKEEGDVIEAKYTELLNKVDGLKVEELKTTIETLNEAIEKQGLEIVKFNKFEGNKPKTLKVELEEKADSIKGLISGTVKALTVRASVTDNEEAYTLPDIGQLPTADRNAYNIFPKIRISEKNDNGIIRYYDWDDATTVRAAAMVAEGAAFPESTAKWEGKTMPIKKIGDSIPYTAEMEEDSQMFAAELGLFLDINVKIKENDQIVNGDGTGQNLTGLFTSIPAYIPVASGISDASIYDLIVKLREDIESDKGGKYNTDFGLMNLTDINKYKLKKDSNNNYIMPPFYDAAGNRIDGVTIIEDNSVTANTMAVGDRRFGRVYEKTGYEMTKGMVNNQFLEDEMTFKVRKRLAFLIREVDKTGFLKVTDIDAALTTLATT
jgi:HK97 family phage major capsid protein